MGGVEDELAVEPADAHGAEGAQEGQFAEHEGRGGGVDAEDVALVLAVDGHEGVVDLDVVEEAFREQGADGAVGDAGREDFLFGGAAFALEVAAGEAARGVEALAVFDLQREEVDAFARLGGGGDGGEDHGLPELAGGLAGRLAGQQARFERHGFVAEGDADGRGVLHFCFPCCFCSSSASSVLLHRCARGRGAAGIPARHDERKEKRLGPSTAAEAASGRGWALPPRGKRNPRGN